MVVVAVVLVVGCLLLLVRLSTPPVKSAPKAVFVLVDYKAVYLCLHASAFSLLCFLFFTHTHTLILVLVYICTGHRKTTWLFSLCCNTTSQFAHPVACCLLYIWVLHTCPCTVLGQELLQKQMEEEDLSCLSSLKLADIDPSIKPEVVEISTLCKWHICGWKWTEILFSVKRGCFVSY